MLKYDIKDKRNEIELCSNRNFVRKWGLESSTFNNIIQYQNINNFKYDYYKIGLISNHKNVFLSIEPFIDKITTTELVDDYIESEQLTTRFDLKSKFEDVDNVDVVLSYGDVLTIDDLKYVQVIRMDLPKYEIGTHQIGNWTLEVKNKI